MEKEQVSEGSNDEDAEILNIIPAGFKISYESNRPSSPSSGTSKIKYYKQTYRSAWELLPHFRGWLRGVVDQPTRAYCTYCEKTLYAHRLSLLKHTCTLRHQRATQLHKVKKIDPVTEPEEQVQMEEHDESGEEYSEAKVESEEENMSAEDDGVENITDKNIDSGSQDKKVVNINPCICPISTEVTDSTRGCNVSGLQVSLYKLISGRWTYINEGLTNKLGKFSNFIQRDEFTAGRYKLHYEVGRHFEASKQKTFFPFVEIVFDCRSKMESCHIPLLISPFGYTTFKGKNY